MGMGRKDTSTPRYAGANLDKGEGGGVHGRTIYIYIYIYIYIMNERTMDVILFV